MNIRILALACIYFMIQTPVYSQLQHHDKKFPVEGPKYDSIRPQINLSKPLFIDGNPADPELGRDVTFSCIITPFTTAIPTILSFENYTEWMRYVETAPNDSLRVIWQQYRGKASYAWIGSSSAKETLKYLFGRKTQLDYVHRVRYGIVKLPNSRIAFAKGLDTTKLVTYLNGVIKKLNHFTIQLTTTNNPSDEEMAKVMINAVEFQYGLKCTWEKQTKKCIVFSRNGNTIPEHKVGDAKTRSGNSTGRYHLLLNNHRIRSLIEKMEDYFPFTQYPFVDETGFKNQLGNFEFYTDGPELTYESLRENLAKLGIKISIEDREVDVLVVSGR